MIRFAFIGGTARGLILLDSLLKRNLIPLFCIISEEDKHETHKYSGDIELLLKRFNIPYEVKKKLSKDNYKKLQDLDFAVVYGWRTLIDISSCDSLKLGFIAAHHSILPKYRGFAPLQWAIINGEKETGVTLFKINEGEIDSGNIIAQKRIQIGPDEYAGDVDKRLIESSVELYTELFKNYETKKISFTGQNDAEATYTCKRTPDDGKIDWTKTSFEIFNLIRALADPFPGAFCDFRNIRYHIKRAGIGTNNLRKYSGRIPGRIVKIFPEGIEVLCGEGTIRISEWENKSTGITNVPSEIVKSVGDTLK